MKFSCELNQARWLSQPKSIVTVTQMWTKKVGKPTVQWDGEQHKNSCQGAFMSVLHPFLLVDLEISRYVEGRDYEAAACSSRNMCLK